MLSIDRFMHGTLYNGPGAQQFCVIIKP